MKIINVKFLKQTKFIALNKKLITLLALTIIYSIPTQAQHTLTDDDVVVKKGMIVECPKSSTDWSTGNIVIPQTLDGQTIKGIGASVFENKEITNVLLPITIEYIGDRTFAMNRIENITIPKSIIFLGKDIFAASNMLRNIYFEPESKIRIISKGAFYVGSCGGCLNPVTLPTNNNDNFIKYKNINGIEYLPGDKIGNFTVLYIADLPPYELKLEDVEFADGIISGYHNWYSKILIPSNFDGVDVTSISEKVFYNCSLLSVEIPSSITSIGVSAFGNNILKNITIPNGVKIIRDYVFANNSLSTISIPNNVTSIGDYAFSYNSLTSLVIPESVTYIGKGAFIKNSISVMNIPSNVNFIGGGAFNCNRITQINSTNSNGLVFKRNNDGTIDNSTIVSYGGISDTINFIPESVKTIGNNAFEDVFDNIGIRKVIIPNGVSHIGITAFYDNELDSITIPNSIKRIEQQAFSHNLIKSVCFEPHSNLTFFGMGVFSQNYTLDSVRLPVPELPNGYKSFIGWFEDGDTVKMPITNLWGGEYNARFQLFDYKINYRNVGSLNNTYNPHTYNVENEIFLRKPYDSTGYAFAGWFVDELFNDSISVPAIKKGTIGDTSFYAKWVIKTGIENKNIFNVNVYPNPIQDLLTIKSKDLYFIQIFDINGKEIFRKKMKNTIEEINMNHCISGIYILTMSNNNGIIRKKIVKE